MVFNDPFNNISVISWRSLLLMEETGVPGENHRPATSHRQTLSHNVVSRTPKEFFFYHKCNFSRKIKICRKIIFVKMT
jgi:hypothetical protein